LIAHDGIQVESPSVSKSRIGVSQNSQKPQSTVRASPTMDLASHSAFVTDSGLGADRSADAVVRRSLERTLHVLNELRNHLHALGRDCSTVARLLSGTWAELEVAQGKVEVYTHRLYLSLKDLNDSQVEQFCAMPSTAEGLNRLQRELQQAADLL
jgi:hypothetical protein